jgi:type IV pilus assembly protein PilQ
MEAQALAGELKVLTRALSYAKSEDLKKLLEDTVLSKRGAIQIDPRTNTLIINDLPDRLARAGELITVLDVAQPQVEIEARIVETSRSFARQLGVQWGFSGITTQAPPDRFRALVDGRQGALQGPQPVESVVNLAASGASSAIGVAIGTMTNTLNLDVALSALETTGQGRILSTPRVSTQNNVEAEITQGIQIPIQTVANNTVTVTFKDAALTLKVTPQITAANTVIMQISVENASPDFSRQVNNIPPIDTQRANTRVQVSNGETTVIGGIYKSREQTTEDRTPGLHRIPLLGWLFKRDTVTDENRELLIFITPKISRL